VSEPVAAQRAAPAPPDNPVRGNSVREKRAQRVAPLQFMLAAFLTVALDQLSKVWVRRELAVGESQTVLSGWLDWTHSQNTGAAWSMLAGQRWFLVLVSIGVAIFIALMARDFARHQPARVLPLCALGFIFGGAIGNLIDRIAFGVVTDFIDLGTPVRFIETFPIFNIADSALTVGVILLALHFVIEREEKPQTNVPPR
jgi:signal peptidase II